MKQETLMIKTIRAFAVIASTGLTILAAAETVRQITWDDLIPAHLIKENYLANLTEKQKDLVMWVINTIETLPVRGKGTEEYWKQVDEAMPTLRKYGIDIVKVMEKRKKFQTAVVNDLNGKNVRLPGYMLPLEMSGSKVTEFLLVPYVGACIHVPPPPPNQIVHVKTAAKKGYNSRQLYEPVWVTGVISVQSMVKNLYLVDGSADIDIGYAMQTNRIEPYE
jgi:hypothetical protein